MNEPGESKPYQTDTLAAELSSILARGIIPAAHSHLKKFVYDNSSNGLGHLYLGMSYFLNRFDATLELPQSVLVFGGPDHAPREMVKDHLEKAEEHLRCAMEVDSGLTTSAITNIASVELLKLRFGPVIVYIEDQLKKSADVSTPQLKSTLAIAYREMGEYDQALSLFHSLLGTGLKFIHCHIALTLLSKGDLIGARDALSTQCQQSQDETYRYLLQAIDAEIQGKINSAIDLYREVAARWRYDGIHQLSGLNAARNAARLCGDKEWKLTDYCDQLTY
jgi:tetratricopeptide (TPR) repeat protein